MGFERFRRFRRPPGRVGAWLGRGLGWALRRGIDLAMRLSGWSGRRVHRRWFGPSERATPEDLERRVHPLFWLGLLMLAALALASPFLSLGAITLLMMLLRPVAVLIMALGVILKR